MHDVHDMLSDLLGPAIRRGQIIIMWIMGGLGERGPDDDTQTPATKVYRRECVAEAIMQGESSLGYAEKQ